MVGGEDTAPVMRRREFESLPVLLFFDNSAHHNAPMRAPTEGWSAAACRRPPLRGGARMAKVRVQLPLGALDKQDVGKPGIPPGTVRSMVAGARDRRFKSGRSDLDCGGTRVGTGRRLLIALTQVRFLPPQLRDTEGQANWRWQPPRKRSSDEPWGFDSLTFRLVRLWPSGKGPGLPIRQGGFDSHKAL